MKDAIEYFYIGLEENYEEITKINEDEMYNNVCKSLYKSQEQLHTVLVNLVGKELANHVIERMMDSFHGIIFLRDKYTFSNAFQLGIKYGIDSTYKTETLRKLQEEE